MTVARILLAEGTMRDEFPTLLEEYRVARGYSRHRLAREVGIDPSYLQRIAYGQREPPRQHIIEALTRALRLSVPERNRLLVSAGYAPLSIMQLGGWDEALQAVTDVLNDVDLSPEERDEFRQVIRLLAARWRTGGEAQTRYAT